MAVRGVFGCLRERLEIVNSRVDCLFREVVLVAVEGYKRNRIGVGGCDRVMSAMVI